MEGRWLATTSRAANPGRVPPLSKVMDELIESLRAQADEYEADGAMVRGELVLRRVADQLEAFQRRTLSVVEAAALTNYTPAHLRELARDGRIPAEQDAGGHWQFREGELPRKPPTSAGPVDELARLRRKG